MLVTVSGAPAVMVVAVVTSPVLAVKVPPGTKLKPMRIGVAQAGEALKAATAITVPRRAFLLLLRMNFCPMVRIFPSTQFTMRLYSQYANRVPSTAPRIIKDLGELNRAGVKF